MKTTFLPLMGAILISVLPKPGIPADVAPPPEAIAVVSVGALIVLGLCVVAIVGVSFLVIRAIKKNNSRKDGP